jgi:hypothetical protein
MARKSEVGEKRTPQHRRGPARPEPGQKSDRTEQIMTAAAKALGLPIKRDWASAVRSNLQLLLRHAKMVDEFPLPDDIDPAPVFRA